MKIEGVILFELEKETKNCYRFKEIIGDQAAVIGTLYVQKWVFNEKPKMLEMRIREKGGEVKANE